MAKNSDKPQFATILVMKSLNRFFKGKSINKSLEEMEMYCLSLPISQKNLAKVYLKFQTLRLEKISIKCVLESLDIDRRKLIEEHYRVGTSFERLAFELNVSVAQLHVWHRRVLSEIEDMLFYRLNNKDYFLLSKMLNMIFVLSKQLDFLDEVYGYMADPTVIRLLSKKKCIVEKIYQNLLYYITKDDNSIDHKVAIIKAKSNNVEYTNSEIANQCNFSDAMVSKILNAYINEVHQIIICQSKAFDKENSI